MIGLAVGPGRARFVVLRRADNLALAMSEIERAVRPARRGRPLDEMLWLGRWAGARRRPVDVDALAKGDLVQFGIFYEHQLPRPWDPAPSSSYRRRPRSDRAGRPARIPVPVGGRTPLFGGVFPLVRARGLPGGRESADEAMRLGHGIIQTAPPYNHPARTAERLAMLDLVSGGRVEFGSGESSPKRSSAGSASIRR